MQQQAVKQEVAAAMQAFRNGSAAEAERRLALVIEKAGEHPHALNGLAIIAEQRGAVREAAGFYRRAIAADPKAPVLRVALARVQRAAGDLDGEIASLDQALALDPYLLPALLQKAQALERGQRPGEAAAVYRALIKTTPSDEGLPPQVVEALRHGRAVVAADNQQRAHDVAGFVESILPRLDDEEAVRVRRYVEQLSGTQRIYHPEPTGPHFPFLPAYEYFPRHLFPWLSELEAATPVIREDYLALCRERPSFDPYVQFEAGTPTNQWAALNHSPDWGAFFLWKDGQRLDENCALCPRAAAAVERLPLLDVPGRAPTVMYSVLQPHTHIPPHTGVTNTRATIHLPLIVPAQCGFRVGGETRPWREGVAWAFDDTIEHEAWNDSDQPRVIMIIDGWNPFLSEAEREVVRTVARGAPAAT